MISKQSSQLNAIELLIQLKLNKIVSLSLPIRIFASNKTMIQINSNDINQ
jgi:hypothetical protein